MGDSVGSRGMWLGLGSSWSNVEWSATQQGTGVLPFIKPKRSVRVSGVFFPRHIFGGELVYARTT